MKSHNRAKTQHAPRLHSAPFINRELSWIEFNHRVLTHACDARLPLLERVRFLSITASNLDEFSMVRVGGLQLLEIERPEHRDIAGMTPAEQLAAVGHRVTEMLTRQYACWQDQLQPALADAGVRRLRVQDLTASERRHAADLFSKEIFPLLTPVAIAADGVFPTVATHTFFLGICLDPAADGTARYAVVPLPRTLNRLVPFPAEKRHQFMFLEDLIGMFIQDLFPGIGVTECTPFRLIRNADMSVREDQAGDLVTEMQAVLDARKRSDCVRLDIHRRMSSPLLMFLKEKLDVTDRDTYALPGPLDLTGLLPLTRLAGRDELQLPGWKPQPSPIAEPGESIFTLMADHDILLYHPSDDYEPVVRFIEEAARDPDVLAIKQVLYRTSRSSPIVDALILAARQGKNVTALIELKARFDEARNMEWGRALEDAGGQVIYGVKRLKTHAKVCMVIRREPQGYRRYLHFGTGNYNEVTARLYCDVSYMTCNEDLANDAAGFFNAITGYSQPQRFTKLDASPHGIRARFLELIELEIKRHQEGQPGRIDAKLNSLTDPPLIQALYRASQAGVKIRLNIRGICCLRPGVKGMSDNIVVTSIVDRYLEHSRIMYFHNGGAPRFFISSADWMPRNLDRRVELLVPIEDPAGQRRLLEVLDMSFRDNANAWRLNVDGTYERLKPKTRRKGFRSQEAIQQLAQQRAKALKNKRTTFEAYRASSQHQG